MSAASSKQKQKEDGEDDEMLCDNFDAMAVEL